MAMLKGFLGRKLGMTRIYNEFGQVVPVTVIEAGPCAVARVKTTSVDGYNAVQLGFAPKPLHKFTRPEQGHFKRAGLPSGFCHIEEFRVDDTEGFAEGRQLTLNDIFLEQLVDVSGVTKGKGFAGTVKRHGFHRGKMTHGSKCHREMGSIGQSAYPSRVLKGKKMPGRMGGRQCTVENLMVVEVRPEENLLFVKGAVPGANNQLVQIRCK